MNTIARRIVAVATLFMAAHGWSYTISSGATNVGGLDTLINTGGTSPANQDPGTVLSWINTYLNPDASSITRTDSPIFYQVDGSTNYFAIALTGTPDYFHLFNANYDALFQNNGAGANALNWGVFDITPFIVQCNGNNPGVCNSLNINGTRGQISHVDSVGTHASVPEPGSVSLLAAGMLGLVMARRFLNKA